MEFNPENYPLIKQACESKQTIEFYTHKTATCFADSEAPDIWTPLPPAELTKEAYAQIFALSGNDARGTLLKLELTVHLDGGKIQYKKRDKQTVDIRVMF